MKLLARLLRSYRSAFSVDALTTAGIALAGIIPQAFTIAHTTGIAITGIAITATMIARTGGIAVSTESDARIVEIGAANSHASRNPAAIIA